MGNGSHPSVQCTVTDELTSFIAAMDKENISPACDPYNCRDGDFQQTGDIAEAEAKSLSGLNLPK